MEDVFVPLAIGCVVALASALAVVVSRKPVHAAVALLVHSLTLASLYGILGAGMVAVGQVIIYSGAIVVLFLFVVTLLPTGTGGELVPAGGRVAAAVVAAGALLVALASAMASGLPAAVANPTVGVDAIGHALFGPLLVAFELTAPLLLVAIVAAVAIWRRFEPYRPTPTRAASAGPRRVVMHR